MHHPFTSPQNLDPNNLRTNPTDTLAKAYDIVINGYEIGGGSIRIHQSELQKQCLNYWELMNKKLRKNLVSY